MFKAIRLHGNSNFYMIVREDAVKGSMFTKLPFEVYGFLKVVGKDLFDANVVGLNIASEVNNISGCYRRLKQYVINDYFN